MSKHGGLLRKYKCSLEFKGSEKKERKERKVMKENKEEKV
jgi:hypothetical protein